MKLLKLVIPAAAATLLAFAGTAIAQNKKPLNTSAGAGAPTNFPTPMPNENGDYTQGGKPTAADAATTTIAPNKKTKVSKHKKKASTSS
jgi:hypothetical protein